jgi:hypothetical protein
VSEALVLLNTAAVARGRKWGRDPGQLAEEFALRTDEKISRVPMPYASALEQVLREVDADFAYGRR